MWDACSAVPKGAGSRCPWARVRVLGACPEELVVALRRVGPVSSLKEGVFCYRVSSTVSRQLTKVSNR